MLQEENYASVMRNDGRNHYYHSADVITSSNVISAFLTMTSQHLLRNLINAAVATQLFLTI